jgi:RNA polymerase sigma factor (sigma-70 family)
MGNGPGNPEGAGLSGSDLTTSFHAQRAVTGDASSLEWLIARVSPLLLLQAELRLSPPLRRTTDPDDLVADVWAIALPRLSDIQPAGGHYARVVVKFLSTTLLNRVNDLSRRHIRERRRPASGEKDPGPRTDTMAHLPDEGSGAMSRAVRREREGALWNGLQELGEEDRRIIVLRGIEGHPQNEVATLLGLEPGTVAVRYHRALKRLRERIPESILDDL